MAIEVAMRFSLPCLLFVALAGCSERAAVHHGDAAIDAGTHDGATDGAALEGPGSDGAPVADGGGTDGAMDAAASDAGHDAGTVDAGHDGGVTDAGHDAGGIDAGRDAGPTDAGRDAGLPDLGPPVDGGPVCSAPLHIGIFGADDAPAHVTVKGFLDGTGRFATVDILGPATATFTPTLAALDAYDAILVWGSGTWDGLAVGNVLADYIDQGHGVVIMVFAQRSGSVVGVDGRMLTAGYLPYVPASHNVAPLTLGSVALPTHPIMAGVATLSGSAMQYHDGTLSPGATLVASWSNGRPLVGTIQPSGGRSVLLGFYPVRFWDTTTDGARLMANALQWSACGS